MKYSIYPFVLASIFLLLSGCESEKEAAVAPGASIEISFSHNMHGLPLVFENEIYENAAGNRFNIQSFNYYVSNIKLRNRANGDLFVEPNSYHLIRAGQNESITIAGIPQGNYTEVEFSIGVDNAKNLSTDQVGDLDPANNMVWDWNTGYKFLLLEGRFFPTDPSQNDRGLVFHIGTDPNFQTLTYRLNLLELSSIDFNQKQTARLQFGVELANIFQNPNTINLEQNNVVMYDAASFKVSENYATDVFQLLSVDGISAQKSE